MSEKQRKKTKKKKRRKPLPNELLIIDNPDKVWHESWTKGRNILNFPHPFRAVLFGPPEHWVCYC